MDETTRTNEEVVSTLNELIETCRDGENGFRTAAENTESSRLKSMFREISEQRARFADELQQEVNRLGGRPAKSGSLAGAAHRGWMNIRAGVTGVSDRQTIEEAERGEDSAVKAYRSALASGLPSSVRSIVERQSRSVQETHDRIRTLERGEPETFTGRPV
ncbi:MAG: PA2169 family four-helix-bundle protein [Bryobacteraceae bacterium]